MLKHQRRIMAKNIPSRIGDSWFVETSTGVSKVSDNFVETNYPMLMDFHKLSELHNYIEKTMKRGYISKRVGYNIIRQIEGIKRGN
jgi:hypothetical protein